MSALGITPTPGPWRVGDDACGDPLSVWGPPGICITSMFDSKMGPDAPPLHEAKANARLCAAAPEMLDALRQAMTVIDTIGLPSVETAGAKVVAMLFTRRANILAAIDKATSATVQDSLGITPMGRG